MMARPGLLALAATLSFLAGCGETVGGPFGPPMEGTGSGGGGGAGSGVSSTGAGSMPVCMPGELGFQGTLDGQAVVYNPTFGSFVIPANMPGLPLLLVADLDPGGMLVLPNFIEDTSPHALALLRIPDDNSPNAGVWYAFGAGTEVHLVDQDKVAFTLASPVRLGTCPGSPVAGELDYCYDGVGDTGCSGQKSSTSVTLDGMPVTWDPETVDSVIHASGDAYVGWKNEGFVVARAGGTGIISMPLHAGELFAGPYEGALLCVEHHQIGSLTSTFDELSFLTTFAGAPAVEGTLSSCP